jgi:hypothetical protein
MAENVDRHLNSVMILEHFQSASRKQMGKWQIFRPHSSVTTNTLASSGGWGTIHFSHLPTAKRFVDGRKTYRWSSTER